MFDRLGLKGVETPGGRAGTEIFQYQAVEHSPEGYTFMYKVYKGDVYDFMLLSARG